MCHQESLDWIGSCSNAISAIAATITVLFTWDQIKKEKERNRAYLSLCGIKLNKDLTIHLKNIGLNPLEGSINELFLIDENYKWDKNRHQSKTTTGNDIPTNQDLTLIFPTNLTTSLITPRYFVLRNTYKDQILNKQYRQIFVIKWLGKNKENQILDFRHASIEEKNNILEVIPN